MARTFKKEHELSTASRAKAAEITILFAWIRVRDPPYFTNLSFSQASLLSCSVLYAFPLFGWMSFTREWKKDIFSDRDVWILTKERYAILQLLIDDRQSMTTIFIGRTIGAA